MSVGEQMSLADVKNRLSEVVDRLQREHGRVVITKHGHPAAVVISVEDLESLEETLDVMGSEALLGDIREALAELATADAPVLSKDEALRLISDRLANRATRSPGRLVPGARWPGCRRRWLSRSSNSSTVPWRKAHTGSASRSSWDSRGCTAPAAATTG